MKRTTFTSLALALCGATAMAQPTLTAATSTPGVGLHDTLYQNTTTFLPGNAGANQTWDFSNQSYPSVVPAVYEACNSSNNCSSFPGTTVVEHAGSNYVYYAGSANAYSITGYYTSGTTIPNQDPEDFYRFPFSYGNTYTDTWNAVLNSGGMTYYRGGIDTVTADAWGTLITPAGTFPNTLRIKRVMTYRDSADMGGVPMILDYKTTLYTWNDVSHKDVLYSTSSMVTTIMGSSQTANFSTYIGGQGAAPPTGIEDTKAGAITFRVFPNPAHDEVHISADILNQTDLAIYMTDVTGRQVYNGLEKNLSAGSHQFTVPVSGIPAGIYVVRIKTGDNRMAVQKLVIQ